MWQARLLRMKVYVSVLRQPYWGLPPLRTQRRQCRTFSSNSTSGSSFRLVFPFCHKLTRLFSGSDESTNSSTQLSGPPALAASIVSVRSSHRVRWRFPWKKNVYFSMGTDLDVTCPMAVPPLGCGGDRNNTIPNSKETDPDLVYPASFAVVSEKRQLSSSSGGLSTWSDFFSMELDWFYNWRAWHTFIALKFYNLYPPPVLAVCNTRYFWLLGGRIPCSTLEELNNYLCDRFVDFDHLSLLNTPGKARLNMVHRIQYCKRQNGDCAIGSLVTRYLFWPSVLYW